MVIRGADEAGSRSEERRRRRTPTFATRPIIVRRVESGKLPRDRTDPTLSLLYQLWTGLLLDFVDVFCDNVCIISDMLSIILSHTCSTPQDSFVGYENV